MNPRDFPTYPAPSPQPAVPPEFVYFDLGNVLVNFSHRRAAEQMGQVAGIDPEQVWQVVFEGDLQHDLETGQIDSREFCRRFAQSTQSEFDPLELVQAASDIFWVNQPIVPLVRRLAATPVRMGILSNTCDAHWRHVCTRFPWVTELFPLAVLSYEVGAMKPFAEIYRAAIERANVAPDRILFVDDRPENIQGARAAGLDAHLFTTATDFHHLLNQRGLETSAPQP